MHMVDSLISPAVGGVLCAASAGLAAWSARQVQREPRERLIPLMGVTGAFVFAAQMINFGIPGTGSSGHLGGGLLLAALVGPHAAFLVMVSILVIQALCFADGGLLALGCNIFNLGFFPCFLAYPLLFRPLIGTNPSSRRLLAACLLAAVVGLELGAMGVAAQTTLSGRSELPFVPFLVTMLVIHLAIGVVEGLATASVLGFVWKARPELMPAPLDAGGPWRSLRGLAAAGLLASLLIGGVASSFASSDPDGLEWSIEKVAGTAEPAAPGPLHEDLAKFQQRAALLPDYGFPVEANAAPIETPATWARVSLGTSVAGVVGSTLVLLAAACIGYVSRFAGVLRTEP